MLTEGTRHNTGRRHARLGRFCHPSSAVLALPEEAIVGGFAKSTVISSISGFVFYVLLNLERHQNSRHPQYIMLVVVFLF